MTSGDLYGQALTVGSVPAMHAADPVTRHKVAITEDERRLTWQELDERSTRVAAGLIRYGVRQGDPVALYSGNRIEYIELMYGLAKAGCPIVRSAPGLSPRRSRARSPRPGPGRWSRITPGRSACPPPQRPGER